MFTFKVDNEIEIELLQQHHKEELFNLIDENRDHLRKWLFGLIKENRQRILNQSFLYG
jgi:ribosomal-protein-serine acetyltransferase